MKIELSTVVWRDGLTFIPEHMRDHFEELCDGNHECIEHYIDISVLKPKLEELIKSDKIIITDDQYALYETLLADMNAALERGEDTLSYME
jgi:hypothetical protein